MRVQRAPGHNNQAVIGVMGFAKALQPAHATAGPDRIVVEGAPVALSVSFTDPGVNDTHSIGWTVRRNAVTFAAGSGSNFSFTPTDEGVYDATVTVTDSNGSASTDTVRITATNARRPIQ